MAYTAREISRHYRRMDEMSPNGKARFLRHLLDDYYDADSEANDLMVRIFNDPNSFKNLSNRDIDELRLYADRLDTPWRGSRYDRIMESLANAKGSRYEEEKAERQGRYDDYRKDIDERRDRYEDISKGRLRDIRRRSDRFEDYRGDFEEQKSNIYARSDELFNEINKDLEAQRALNNQILEDAKRFNMSPSMAQAQFEQNQVALENRLKQQAALRGQGQTKDPISSRQDIGREIGQSQLGVDKIREHIQRQALLQGAKRAHLRTTRGIDSREAGARDYSLRQKNVADQKSISQNIDLDKLLSALEREKTAAKLLGETGSDRYLADTITLDRLEDSLKSQYNQKHGALQDYKDEIGRRDSRFFTGLGAGALKTIGGVAATALGAPKVGIPLAGSAISDFSSALNYRQPSAPDLSFLNNLDGEQLAELLKGFRGSQGGQTLSNPPATLDLYGNII